MSTFSTKDVCQIKISELSYLHHLPRNTRNNLCQNKKIFVVKKDQIINKDINSLYIVLTGSYLLRSLSGNLLRFDWAFSSSNVSELGFLLSKRVANVVANSECIVIEIPKSVLKKTLTTSQYKILKEKLQDLFVEKINIDNIFEYIKQFNIYSRSIYYFGFGLISLLLYSMISLDIYQRINFSPE